jgi:phage host-nuclease inhibitor protein Gam
MNPFGKPDILKFDPSKYSKPKATPQMSKVQPAMSKVSDTQASSQARYNQMFGASKAPAPTPAGAKPSSSTPVKASQPPKEKSSKPQKSAQQQFEEDIRKQIENAYSQQINFLTGQEASLQAQLPDYLTSIERPFEAQLPFLEQQLTQQQETGATQQEQLRQQEQQLFAQARRTGEEAGLRAVQQFGGVGGSSAAQAAGEIIGREQLRQQGAISQQRAQGIQSINDQLRAIQGEYNAQVANLKLQKEQAVSNARLEFQRQLDTIRKEKMQAGVTKAQMTIDALTSFAARRQSIEDQARAQENNLTLLREQATLNAQNLRLQSSLTPQSLNVVPADFKTTFFGPNVNSMQSNELAKVLQAGLAAGTIKPFGKNPSNGEDLFIDAKGNIAGLSGNLYGGTGAPAPVTTP